MIKKGIKTSLIIIILFFAYLFIANWQIYYRIDKAKLKATDNRHIYIFNENVNNSSLVYGAMGDSITSGVGVSNYEESYTYQVAQKIAGTSIKVTHFNYSYPGAKTSDVIKDLLPNLIIDKPDVITLLIGINDVHGNVSKTKFKKNYEIILFNLKNQTQAKINVTSIPFIGSNSLLWPPYNYYYKTKTISFNKIIKELAGVNNINYIDLTTPTLKYASSDSPYYSKDRFHPSYEGYKYWAKIIYDNLSK